MKKIIKKILLWDLITLENKKRIKSIFGQKTVHRPKPKPKPKPKVEVNPFNRLFNQFSVVKADFSHYEVALYFAGGMGNLYQVEQWLGPLSILDSKKRITIIVRDKKVFTWLAKNTDLTVIYCLTIENLTNFYEENNFKCILYVNHGFKNFQSLIIGDALHVHINHGESDKSSTISNQSKAYDYIFIVAQAAYDKYRDNLIKVDMSKFIKVGRPQLEHIVELEPFETNYIYPIIEEKPILEDESSIEKKDIMVEEQQTPIIDVDAKSAKKIILYAPTWEATHDSMNFTSLNDYGLTLVSRLLENPNYYLLYKPHPNTGSRDSVAKRINNEIQKMINEHLEGEIVIGGDINSLYAHVDLAIFDNSAVAIDYLQVDKPMIMTDMFYRLNGRNSKPVIIQGARMLSVQDAENIIEIVKEELELDTMQTARNSVKEYYLGNYNYGEKESTQKFVNQVIDICLERDKLVESLKELNINQKPFSVK